MKCLKTLKEGKCMIWLVKIIPKECLEQGMLDFMDSQEEQESISKTWWEDLVWEVDLEVQEQAQAQANMDSEAEADSTNNADSKAKAKANEHTVSVSAEEEEECQTECDFNFDWLP